MATAIEFNHVSKMYQLGIVGTGTLSNDLKRWWTMSVLGKEDPFLKIGQTNDRTTKGSSDFVYALRDIDFKVEQGDVVGIIGKNGAGKSTLLKLLSRITAPTTGTIKAKGRIASLLEVGTGFHPELTGRENIYMNGTIMGMKRHEIDAKLDEIVDFAGVERYLDTPTKRYSSGMTVRLGFAVAAFLEPEILVVDEVLAVGDAEFQKKAIGKMQDVSSGEGRTVLFVSHNMNSVRQLCKSGIVLKNGMIEMMGTADECVDFYTETSIEKLIGSAVVDSKKHRPYGSENLLHDIEILEAKMCNDVNAVSLDEPLDFKIKLKKNKLDVPDFHVTLIFTNEQDVRVAMFDSAPVSYSSSSEITDISVSIPHHGLAKGKYRVDVEVGNKDYHMGSRNYDMAINLLSFEVKYIHRDKKDEFFSWSRTWGETLHHEEGVYVNFI